MLNLVVKRGAKIGKRKGIVDFGFRISDFGFRIADCACPPAEKAGQAAKGGGIEDFGLWIANCRFRINQFRIRYPLRDIKHYKNNININ